MEGGEAERLSAGGERGFTAHNHTLLQFLYPGVPCLQTTQNCHSSNFSGTCLLSPSFPLPRLDPFVGMPAAPT